jgi:hypothetical protein
LRTPRTCVDDLFPQRLLLRCRQQHGRVGAKFGINDAFPQSVDKSAERQNIRRLPRLQSVGNPVGVEFARKFLREPAVGRNDGDTRRKSFGEAREQSGFIDDGKFGGA